MNKCLRLVTILPKRHSGSNCVHASANCRISGTSACRLLQVCVYSRAPVALCQNVNTRYIRSIKKRGCRKGEGSASVITQTAKLDMRFRVNPAHKAKRTRADRHAVQSGACEAVVSLNMLIKPSLGLNQDRVNTSGAFTHLHVRKDTQSGYHNNIITSFA